MYNIKIMNNNTIEIFLYNSRKKEYIEKYLTSYCDNCEKLRCIYDFTYCNSCCIEFCKFCYEDNDFECPYNEN